MDILLLNDKLTEVNCDPLFIYKQNFIPEIKESIFYQTKHWTIKDYNLVDQFCQGFKNEYTNPVLRTDKGSSCNYAAIIELDQYGFLNSWLFFDQIQSKPSTLTFISKISKSSEPISIEFIRHGKYLLPDYSVIIFPSCFTFAFRINPIKAEQDSIILGSILINK